MRWLDGITDSMDMGLGRLWEVGDGQGGLVCCDSWGRKELDTTEQLNWNELTDTAYKKFHYRVIWPQQEHSENVFIFINI